MCAQLMHIAQFSHSCAFALHIIWLIFFALSLSLSLKDHAKLTPFSCLFFFFKIFHLHLVFHVRNHRRLAAAAATCKMQIYRNNNLRIIHDAFGICGERLFVMDVSLSNGDSMRDVFFYNVWRNCY